MGKIHVLDKTVSNMIAAGEVVERPASVVKELLENAMDAQAKHITVEIKAGGVSYIRVLDDGIGMTAEDAKLCLLRHATSKIREAEDLAAIHTLGFRGEALASIAAVSKLDIYTRATGEETGTHIACDCGEMTEPQEAGCPVGTTVIVRDLFCSTPARMKFLKKDFTEAGYIADMMNRLALSHPQISFQLIHNTKEQLFTAGDGDETACVAAVYGREFGKQMLPANYSQPPVHVHGLIGTGSVSRPNRNMQNFFVNGRYIKSPMLARAAEDAYKNEVMVGKFPVFVLQIEIDPSLVDINVHPTKLEAKFADEKNMYHCVYWAVKNALFQNVHIPVVEEKKDKKLFERNLSEEAVLQETKPIKMEEFASEMPKSHMADMESALRQAEQAGQGEQRKKEEKTSAVSGKTTVREAVLSWDYREKPQAELFGNLGKQEAAVEETRGDNRSFPTEKVCKSKELWKTKITEHTETKHVETDAKETNLLSEVEYKICGQVFDTYIIAEKDGDMLMIDQHAAHERLRYEALLRQYQNRTIAAQSLLMPAVVTLSPQEMAIYREHVYEINALGFDTDEFGENAVAVRATPEELSERDISDLLVEMLTMFSENRKHVDEDLVSRMLYSIACKGAVKANHNLHGEEMKALLNALFALEGINTCPHGRPIIISFTKEFIEKQFKRIVS